ncbi:hypothetical protein D3C71_1703030 [compost metagenome]
MDIEISTICTPMGRPLTIKARRMRVSGTNKCSSAEPIHSGWARQRSQPSSAAKPMQCATSVAMAEPLMPMRGTGPQPKMNSGLSAVSSSTTSSRK